MLVMRRREGESILIGEEIEVRILSIDRSKVKIGITAPRHVPVVTREMELVRRENLAASTVSREAAGAVARLLNVRTPTGAETRDDMADMTEEGPPQCRLRPLLSPE